VIAVYARSGIGSEENWADSHHAGRIRRHQLPPEGAPASGQIEEKHTGRQFARLINVQATIATERYGLLTGEESVDRFWCAPINRVQIPLLIGANRSHELGIRRNREGGANNTFGRHSFGCTRSDIE